jgi:cell division protein FtsW
LTSFVNPWGHATTTGYQVVQSMIGLGSGHLIGLGLGNSREKWGLLPNSHTDFIASVIGEELGLIGIVVVLCLIGFLISKGFRAATEAPDRFTTYLAAGLIAWIGAEAIINVGAALDVLPVTGIPLPFISFGGSSLVITLAASGLLVNIARQSVRQGTRSQRPVAKSASAPAKARSKSVSTARKAAPSSKRPGTKSSNSKTTTAAARSARPSARRRIPAPSTRQRKAR